MDDELREWSRWALSRRHFLKVAGAGISLATIGPILEACSTGSTTTTTTITGGTIKWAKPADVLEFDPQTSLNGVSWQIMDLVYETLVNVQDDLTIGPGVAKAWDQPTPNTYVFHLRDGVKFSNGRAMTSGDVVGSLKRLLDPKLASFWAGQVGPVTNIVAVDASTVRVELSGAWTPFLAAIAHIGAAVLPMQELTAGTFDVTKQMLGTGPFAVSSHQQGTSWTLDRNPHYWRSGYPKADKVMITIVPDDSARLAALRDGSSNIALFENPDAPNLLKGIPNVKVVVQDTTDYYRIDVNAKAATSPFRDARVREAFSIAIDRNQIRDIALAGLGTPTGPASPAFHIVAPDQLPYGHLDASRARQLLQDAGAQNLKFNLIASPAFAEFPKIAQVIQQNLSAVGITATIQQLEAGDWEKRVFVDDPGSFDAAISYFAGYADPGMVLAWWNPVKSQWNKGFLNPDPAINQLIADSQSQPNGAARTATLQNLAKAIDQNSTILSLVTRPIIIAYRTDQISPKIQPVEGYVNAFRHIQEYVLLK